MKSVRPLLGKRTMNFLFITFWLSSFKISYTSVMDLYVKYKFWKM